MLWFGIKSLLVWQPQSLSKSSFTAWTYIKADRMGFGDNDRLDKETDACSLSIDRSTYFFLLWLSS